MAQAPTYSTDRENEDSQKQLSNLAGRTVKYRPQIDESRHAY